MTLTIELTPEEEARLQQAALAQGVDAETVLHRLLDGLPLGEEWEEEEKWGNGRPLLEDLDAMFEELAEGHEERPVLSVEATTRANIYADHD